uniref:EGF-like domain-containing protein n=1 Tax=Biomphalaria glabrata TaxID=6526 RepID=A0A2C9LME8_BIOGL
MCVIDTLQELNSDKCSNGNGTFECGKCSCHPGRYGKFCECKADDLTSKDSIKQCTAPNATLPCSGRGSCVCGECLCNTRSSDSAQTFSGPYCECDDYSCNQFNEQICGGPERGKCNCGKCECKLGYNGTACECELSMEKCTTDKGLVCNGHGNCTCGKCVCENQYTGFKCEQCPACPDKCLEYTPCVQCKAFKSGKLTQERCLRECKMEISLHDKIRGKFCFCFMFTFKLDWSFYYPSIQKNIEGRGHEGKTFCNNVALSVILQKKINAINKINKGTFNVRSLRDEGKVEELTNGLNRLHCNIIGLWKNRDGKRTEPEQTVLEPHL